jgi:hypothetical protein
MVQIKGYLLPKDVCSVCFEKMQKGLSVFGNSDEKKPEEKPIEEKT